MNATLIWNNVLAYSLQIGLLVAAGAFVPALVRMRAAGARLVYWQLLLAACLLLPWVRPWHREVIVASVSVTTVVTSVAVPAPEHFHIAWGEWLLYLLAAGVVVRLAWLGVGFWRLRRYRRHAWPLEGVCAHANVLLSADVSSPVTFGWWRPVILLPERFPQLSEPMRQAILCHENLHVARRDWLFTVAEELVRAALWFHPAIWWLLAEIQLAREQAVDARVVAITQSRDPYVDALLEMAGARPELELSPAPLFLRKRHLKQRVVEIVREATMSKTRWISALAASVVFLAGACWLVTGAFPLAAAPQMVSDAAAGSGTGGGFSVVIPPGMRAVALRVNEVAGVAGLVVPGMRVDVLISSNPPSGDSRQGTATKTLLQNIEVLSAGRDFLKDPQGKPVEAQVITVLVTPAEAEMFNLVPATVQLFLHDPSNKALVTAASTADGQVIRYSGPPRVAALISHVAPVYPPLAKQANIQGTVDLSAIVGKDGHVRDLKLVRGHPLLVQAALDAVNQWVYKPTLMNGEPVEIATDIQVNFALDSMGSQTSTPELLNRVEPHYPPLAKQANVQGTVALSATIGKDGKVQDVELVSGHPLLVQAAIDAVKQWVYEPTMINGEATEVNTEISLSFTLPPSGSGEIPPQIHAGSILSQGDRLIVYVKPVYPPEAKQTGILGTVEFSALIGKDGHVRDLKVVSGHPLLIRPALDAVKQWIYKPIMLNGEPVEVRTTILVPFTLQ